jgi:tetratricopeptide (TPR) repeat protein
MNEESLFHEALARSTPQERAAFLDEACAGQPELRAAVEGLLAAHEQSGEFLCPPAVVANETENLVGSTGADSSPALPSPSDGLPHTTPGSAAPAAPAADVPGRVGRYEIRRLLGRGGMGAVYLAHDPEVDRLVALKVPKLAGPDAEERFLREARAAARMRRNDPAGAVADATIALRLDKANAGTWNNRGWAYLDRGQYHQAMADLNEASRLAPGWEAPYVNRGKCYLCLGEYEKALADFEMAAKIQPTKAEWRMICSVIRARLGDAEGARKDRELAIKLDPKVADNPDPKLPAALPPVKMDPELPPGDR